MKTGNTSCSGGIQITIVQARHVLYGIILALISSIASAEEPLPYRIENGLVDQSTFLRWRIFHSTCHGCHGVDATGTSVAPDLVPQVKRLSSWENDPNVKPHILDIYAYLRARSDGVLAPGRPKRQSEIKPQK